MHKINNKTDSILHPKTELISEKVNFHFAVLGIYTEFNVIKFN